MSAFTQSGAGFRLEEPGSFRGPVDEHQESYSGRGHLVKSSKDLTCRYWRLDPDRCFELTCPYSHEWTGTMSPPLPYTCPKWEAGTCHTSQDLCLYTHGKTTSIPTAPQGIQGTIPTAPRAMQAAIPTAPRAMQGQSKCLLLYPCCFIGTRVHDSGNPDAISSICFVKSPDTWDSDL